MKRTHWATYFAIAIWPSAGVADSIQLIPSSRASSGHCLEANSSGYVAAFDGKSFDVFTIFTTCEENDRIPARCEALLRPSNEAPREIASALKDKGYQLVRHRVPADEVLGIKFDDAVQSICKAPKVDLEKKTGPLRQPASFQPITEDEFRRLGVETILISHGTVVDVDWTSWLQEKQALKIGDLITFTPTPQLSDSLKGNSGGKVLLAGKRPGGGSSEDYVVIDGRLLGASPNFSAIRVEAVMQSQGKLMPAANKLQQATGILTTVRPIRVLLTRSTAGGFNWEGETPSNATLKLRVLKMMSESDRIIEVESDSPQGTQVQLRSLRRTN